MKLVAVVLLLAPLVTTCLCQVSLGTPVDCKAHLQQNNNNPSGVYNIQPVGQPIIQVYCDMTTDGGGWTVIQRRIDGSLNFYRPWAEYKNGFGNAAGEYWIGLDNIHSMTTRNNISLRVEIVNSQESIVFARYSLFSVGAGSDYILTVSGFTDGGAGDSLTPQNGQKFSTFDNDQDSSSNNCAQHVSGAFWFKYCSHANPNGPNGMILWPTYDQQLNAISMRIR